uniref:Uncharacterized protein n=1 Tax=Ciona intestinalis TaxID=7719 RepID=H2XUZ3_CIOIN
PYYLSWELGLIQTRQLHKLCDKNEKSSYGCCEFQGKTDRNEKVLESQTGSWFRTRHGVLKLHPSLWLGNQQTYRDEREFLLC